MWNFIKSRLRDSRGANVVEFAAMLPFLLLILLGALEMGRVFYIRLALTSAATAGVHFGAQSSETAEEFTGMQTAAETDFNGAFGLTLGLQLQGGPQTPCCYYACWDGYAEYNQTECLQSGLEAPDCTGDKLVKFVQVDATVQFESLYDYPGFPPTFTMNEHAVMRVP